MANRWDIGPDILEVDTFRIHGVPVPSVVLYLPATMPALKDRRPDSPECFRFSFGVIKQAVMARMQPSGYRKASADLDTDPMSELQSLVHQKCPQENVPFWQIVDEQCTAGLQDADALQQPFVAPFKVLAIRFSIVRVFAVFLAEVEWGIGEDRVNETVLDVR